MNDNDSFFYRFNSSVLFKFSFLISSSSVFAYNNNSCILTFNLFPLYSTQTHLNLCFICLKILIKLLAVEVTN